MSSTDPREPDRDFGGPDGGRGDSAPYRWNRYLEPDPEAGSDTLEPSSPGPRLAAFGFIVAVVAVAVGVISWLAAFEVLLWAAVAALVVAAAMVAVGYRQWRADAEG